MNRNLTSYNEIPAPNSSRQSATYDLVTEFDFIHGDTYDRLTKALEAIKVDPSYAKEVEALKEASPTHIPLSQIVIKLGATWIPIRYYELFCREVFEVELKLFYSDLIHSWEIRRGFSMGMANWDWGWRYDPYDQDNYFEYHKATIYPAVGNKMSDGLFTLALNQSTPVVKARRRKWDKSEINPYFTRQAIAKQNQIKKRFEIWCKEDAKRLSKAKQRSCWGKGERARGKGGFNGLRSRSIHPYPKRSFFSL